MAKKMIGILLALTLVLALGACGGGESASTAPVEGSPAPAEEAAPQSSESEQAPPEPGGELRTVRYVIPGSIPGTEEGFETAMAAINDKLTADLGLAFELETIAWDIWDQKVTLKLTSDEPFDLLHVMEDNKGYGVYLSNEALTDITGYINDYGPNILANVPADLMNAATVNGSIYAIPAYWCEPAKGTYAITIRTDLLEKNNLPVPTTTDELLEAAQVIRDNWDETGTAYIHPLYTEPGRPLHRTFDTYPFTVVEQLLLIDQKGNVSSWIESDEFRQEAEFYARAYDAGLIHPDVLTLPSEWRTTEQEAGRILFREGTGLQSLTNQEKYGYEEDLIWLNPGAEYFSDMAFRNSNVVPVTSRNPDAAVQFVDWVYASQENYDLFFYGVEGYSYHPVDGQYYERLTDDADKKIYDFDNWMFGNLNLIRSMTTVHPSYITSHLVADDSIVPTILYGFQFDSSPVSAEYANSVAEIQSSLYPIRVGITKYDDGIAAAIQNLQASGIDKVVEEYQRQLNDWLATQ